MSTCVVPHCGHLQRGGNLSSGKLSPERHSAPYFGESELRQATKPFPSTGPMDRWTKVHRRARLAPLRYPGT